MSKYTFTSDFVPNRSNRAIKVTHEFEADTIEEICTQFEDFLRGAGFHFDGHIDIVNDYPVEEEKKVWTDKEWTDLHSIAPLSGQTTYPFWGKDKDIPAPANLEVKGRYYVDPPSGWQYGFPAEYDKSKDGSLEEFLLSKGYPQKDIKFALEHTRSWYENETFTRGIEH